MADKRVTKSTQAAFKEHICAMTTSLDHHNDHTSGNIPRVTVGVPAYCNESTIARTLDSVLAQTSFDFEVHISDDNSPDSTGDICRSYAMRDRRIRYTRQPASLKYQNFGWLLARARTEYFMWLAGDDYLDPTFIEKCVATLDSRPDAVLVTPKVAFYTKGTFSRLSRGTYALTGSRSRNVSQYLMAPCDNSRMYGLFRSQPCQTCFPLESYHAWDWAFCLATLAHGKHLELPEVLGHRDLTPPGAYIDLVDRDARHWFERLLPLAGMTRWAWQHGALPHDTRVYAALLDLNLGRHAEYFRTRTPSYGRAITAVHEFLQRYLFWRFQCTDLPDQTR